MTPFKDIIPLIYDELADSELFSEDFSTISRMEKISRLILKSALTDFSVCRKELENHVGYQEFKIKGKIRENETNHVFTLENVPKELCEEEVILIINGEEVIDFDCDFGEEFLTITYDFHANDNVELYLANIGFFEEDLTFEEKYIIALACAFHYIGSLIQTEKYWVQRLGDKDYSITRNSLTNYLALEKNISSTLIRYIKKYDKEQAEISDLT